MRPATAISADGPLRRRYEAMGATLYHIQIPNLYSPSTLRAGWRYADWLRRWGADIVHTHDLYTNIFAIPWARMRTSAATIASRRWWYEAPRPALVPVNRQANRFAHRILANSPGVARLLREEEHVAAHKVIEVLNFLGDPAFQRVSEAERIAQRRAWGLPDDALVVGSVARLAPVKNFAMLLRAAAQLDESVHVVLVGDGPSRQGLEQLARELGIASRTHFLGTLVQATNLHQFFDIGVLCSNSEGFPNSVIESLAAGRAVVATPVGGVTDIIRDGETGLLVNVGDADALASAVRRLQADPALRARLGATGCETVRGRHHQDVVVGELMGLYEKLASERRPRN